MNIFGFIESYCSDLVERYSTRRKLIELADLPHDEIIQDLNGNYVPVVFVSGVSVPVQDFITLDKPDFMKAYPYPESSELFDNYISCLDLYEGEGALSRIRLAIQSERSRLDEDFGLLEATW